MSSSNDFLSRDVAAASVACFSVRASAEAGVLSRLLEPFAKRGLVVSDFHARVKISGGERCLVADIQVEELDEQAAERIAEYLRQLVAVERVLVARKHLASAA